MIHVHAVVEKNINTVVVENNFFKKYYFFLILIILSISFKCLALEVDFGTSIVDKQEAWQILKVAKYELFFKKNPDKAYKMVKQALQIYPNFKAALKFQNFIIKNYKITNKQPVKNTNKVNNNNSTKISKIKNGKKNNINKSNIKSNKLKENKESNKKERKVDFFTLAIKYIDLSEFDIAKQYYNYLNDWQKLFFQFILARRKGNFSQCDKFFKLLINKIPEKILKNNRYVKNELESYLTEIYLNHYFKKWLIINNVVFFLEKIKLIKFFPKNWKFKKITQFNLNDLLNYRLIKKLPKNYKNFYLSLGENRIIDITKTAAKVRGLNIMIVKKERQNYTEAVNYYKKGLQALKLGFLKKAKEFAKKSISFYDLMPENWNLLGIIYEKEGKIYKALKCYKKAVEIAPEYFTGIYNLIRMLKATNQNKKASAILLTLTNKDIKIPDLYLMLAQLFIEKNEIKKAIHYLNKALYIRKSPSYYYWLGIAYYKLKLYEEAIKYFNKTLKLTNDENLRKKLLILLKEVRNLAKE